MDLPSQLSIIKGPECPQNRCQLGGGAPHCFVLLWVCLQFLFSQVPAEGLDVGFYKGSKDPRVESLLVFLVPA